MPPKPVLWLTAAAALILAAVPMVVNAEGGSPPPQPTPIRIDPPLIRGVNTHGTGERGQQADLTPTEFSADSISSPALVEFPVNLSPLTLLPTGQNVPDHSAPAADIGCGPRALAGVLQALEGEGAPTGEQLLAELRRRGLLYAWGTGVEELAYLARLHGFRGSVPFHGFNLDQIQDLLEQGIPVITALGEDGKDGPGHFVTVTGFSEDGEWIWVHDPSLGLRPLSRKAFESAWAAQGNAGLQVSRERTASGPDPLLPWIGLLGMVSALSVLAGSPTFSGSSRRTLEKLRGLLGSRSRKGIGGRLAEPDKVILGWKSAVKEIPVYEWRKVQTGTREVKVEEPVYTRLKVQVGTETRVKKVPVYVRKKIQVGTREVHKLVKVRGRKRRVVTRWKKVVRKVPVYRRFGWTRIRVGTRREVSWKKVRQVKWVPCTHLKRVTRQVPVYEEIQVQQGWREVEEEVPVYEWRRVQSGTRTVTRSEPVYEDKRFRVGTRTVTEKVPVYAGDQKRSGWQEPDDVLSPWWFKMKIKETQWEKRQQEIRNDPYPDIDLAIEYLRNHADTYGIVLTNQEINEIFCKAKWEGWEYFTSEEIESIYGKIKAMRKINIATKNKLHDVTSNPGDIYSIPDLDPKLSNVLFPFKIEILNADDIYRTFIDIPVQTINSETFQRIRIRFLGTDPIKVRKNTYVSNSAKKFGNKHYHTMVIEEGNIAYLFLTKFIDNSWQTIPASKIKIHIQ